jgi:hypothetical protein
VLCSKGRGHTVSKLKLVCSQNKRHLTAVRIHHHSESAVARPTRTRHPGVSSRSQCIHLLLALKSCIRIRQSKCCWAHDIQRDDRPCWRSLLFQLSRRPGVESRARLPLPPLTDRTMPRRDLTRFQAGNKTFSLAISFLCGTCARDVRWKAFA